MEIYAETLSLLKMGTIVLAILVVLAVIATFCMGEDAVEEGGVLILISTTLLAGIAGFSYYNLSHKQPAYIFEHNYGSALSSLAEIKEKNYPSYEIIDLEKEGLTFFGFEDGYVLQAGSDRYYYAVDGVIDSSYRYDMIYSNGKSLAYFDNVSTSNDKNSFYGNAGLEDLSECLECCLEHKEESVFVDKAETVEYKDSDGNTIGSKNLSNNIDTSENK